MPSHDDTAATGAAARVRYECGVCWAVYDPHLGDLQAQVAPGTTFAGLPAQWACPNCDAPKARFMVLGE